VTPGRARRGVPSLLARTLLLLTLPLALSGCLDEDLLRELFPEAWTPALRRTAHRPRCPAARRHRSCVEPMATPRTRPLRRPGARAPRREAAALHPARPLSHGLPPHHRAEVEALLEDGHIAPDRTRTDGECVSYAVEGHTDDGQEVRIVYADCDRETRVVTTIDLGQDWPCECR
jgi:hypothetical protein